MVGKKRNNREETVNAEIRRYLKEMGIFKSFKHLVPLYRKDETFVNKLMSQRWKRLYAKSKSIKYFEILFVMHVQMCHFI